MTVSLKRSRRRETARKNGASAEAERAPRAPPLARVAGEVWGMMFHAVMARKEHMATVAAKFELTLAQAHLLRLLQFGPARTMTSLAEALACDASNVTGIVDRLESRGLIERGAASHDRRIKTITLTSLGNDVVSELTAGFLEPPEELRRLPEPYLRKLRELLLRAFVRWPVHEHRRAVTRSSARRA